MSEEQPFWQRKTLAEMTQGEWESLCDNCGKCCLLKLREETTNEVYATDVSCHLLDLHTCRCSKYATRQQFVPNCVKLKPDTVASLDFLPGTCAYRLLANGKELPWWHPLVSGDREMVHKAGMSIRHKVISEKELKPDEDIIARIVSWAR